MAKVVLKNLKVKEKLAILYVLNKHELKEQWKADLIIAIAPFLGLFILYCMAVL